MVSIGKTMKDCLICKKALDVSEFNIDPTRKDGHHPWCRDCTKDYKKNYYLKNKNKIQETVKAFRIANLEEVREYDRQRGKTASRKLRGRDTWIGRAKGMISGMKRNSLKRGWDWDDSWWNAEDLAITINNGRCAKTGIPFELLNGVQEHFKTNPCTPSVDRKDNSKGYYPENTQIVCWFYNNLKRDHNQEIIDELVEIMLMNRLLSEIEYNSTKSVKGLPNNVKQEGDKQ